jgi:hypothetical protein
MTMKKLLILLLCAGLGVPAAGQRWQIDPAGSIVWIPGDDTPHKDHLEMTGEHISAVLRWSVDDRGAFHAERSLVFPLLRVRPNDTHASLMCRIATDIPSLLAVNTSAVGFNASALQFERVEKIILDGTFRVFSRWSFNAVGAGYEEVENPTPVLAVERTIFPSPTQPLLCERYLIRNIGPQTLEISVPAFSQTVTTPSERGIAGSYIIRAELLDDGVRVLQPGDSTTVDALFRACRVGETLPPANVGAELRARRKFVSEISEKLVLETPDPAVDTEFRYAKVRAAESIVKTRGGYMHAPGGECYYAAIWANDQAEYVNPFFPMLGYDIGNRSALNAFRHFARFMNPEYRPLPSSIIAEGDDIWNGAGDRGDAAMIAYGAARYALARGVRGEAEELWLLVEWCLEYCRRNLTPEGVVASDTDELEGRFPAGKANLCTSALYYDALLSTIRLGQELGRPHETLRRYEEQASELAAAIERHFGATVAGYETYRYFDGCAKLRSWICMPLIAGLKNRSEGTVRALLGKELMTEEGLLTEQGSSTFWDRSTLYALRGIYIAGEADRATEFLGRYARRRLLGDHVPYPIEAWPEGSQRHLAAESGLFCRIVTEGMFGIRPTGFRSFDLTPSMPSGWNRMALRHIRAFESDFDLVIEKQPDGLLQVKLEMPCRKTRTFQLRPGESLRVKLP